MNLGNVCQDFDNSAQNSMIADLDHIATNFYNKIYCQNAKHYLRFNPTKKEIVVLSLFDGISTCNKCHFCKIIFNFSKILIKTFLVKCAIEEAGFIVKMYYASEIEDTAIYISQRNHGESVINVGDVRSLGGQKLKALEKIDLLVGGSPCNELSRAHPGRKGVNGRYVYISNFFVHSKCS